MHADETRMNPWDRAKYVVKSLYSDRLDLVRKANKMIDAAKTESEVCRVLITIRREV